MVYCQITNVDCLVRIYLQLVEVQSRSTYRRELAATAPLLEYAALCNYNRSLFAVT